MLLAPRRAERFPELAGAGFETRLANSGESALLLLPTVPEGALVLVDMLLGDCTGEELVARIEERRPDLRILRVSGSAAGRLLARDLPLVRKPFSPTALQQHALAAVA